MTAAEYIEFALSHPNYRDRSVNDPEFQSMTPEDQEYVISKFDGYGFMGMWNDRKMALDHDAMVDEEKMEIPL